MNLIGNRFRNEVNSQFKKKSSKDIYLEEYFHDGFLVHEFYEKKNVSFKRLSIHKDVIKDVCEIKSPLLIATACLDKLIRLISLKEKIIIGIFNGHYSGINQLDFTSF